jgi:hypothetical protein
MFLCKLSLRLNIKNIQNYMIFECLLFLSLLLQIQDAATKMKTRKEGIVE